MTWIRLDDTFPEHPKVLEVGGDAAWLHVCGLAYCGRNSTDGLIHRNAVTRLSDRKQPLKLADRLVAAGVWDRDGDDFRIHDYLDYNPSRSEVEAARAERSLAKSQAGQLGGIASGVARRKHKRSTNEAQTNDYGTESERLRSPDPTRPDPLLVQVSRQTDSLDTRETVVCRALELYADAQTPGPHVADAAKWRKGVIRKAREEHSATISANLYATDIELAKLMLGTTIERCPTREAWYADPHCGTCDGDGWRNHAAEGAPSMLGPCDCRRDTPYMAEVVQLRKAAI